MAVLHVQLDIDSDVHPELHAMLSTMSKSTLRAERLRQLASTGLIWERLRVPAPSNADLAVPELPVLRDVVEAKQLAPSIGTVARQAAIAGASGRRSAHVPAETAVRVRSRLLRMKEKGLFNNG
jgi:hypothetical protein